MPVPVPAAPTPRRHPQRRGARDGRDRGSVSLEAAMALPLVAVCALALLQVVGVVRDALLAEDLARIGARVAATDPAHPAVTAAVAAAAGDGVTTSVEVLPPLRRPGDTITVTVRLHRPGRWFDVALTGHAAVLGEPILDGAP